MSSSASQSALGASPETRLAYRFGDGVADGDASMRELLGGKGAGLHEMSRLGVPVPPGFTIPTSVCNDFHREGGGYPDGLQDQVRAGLAWVEERVGTRFGDAENPLLLSVRSGARASMPGMMDTVLNLGLNDRTAEGLARKSGDPRFAYDSYRRFVAMYSDVVLGVKRAGDLAEDPFEALLEASMAREGVRAETDLSAGSLRELVGAYKGVVRAKLGRDFPDDPWEQLWNAIGAVFDSWNTQRAIVYRDLYGYPHDWGTACTVQSMVFGNLGDDCATASASRATRRAASRASSANTWSTRRARTSSRACARRCRSSRPAARPAHRPRWRRRSRGPTPRWRRPATGSSSTSATCRTSSSRCSRGGSGSCKRGRASAPARRWCASRRTWWRRG